jgi:hypothetical protein
MHFHPLQSACDATFANVLRVVAVNTSMLAWVAPFKPTYSARYGGLKRLPHSHSTTSGQMHSYKCCRVNTTVQLHCDYHAWSRKKCLYLGCGMLSSPSISCITSPTWLHGPLCSLTTNTTKATRLCRPNHGPHGTGPITTCYHVCQG